MEMFQETLIGRLKPEIRSRAAIFCPFTLGNQHVKSNKMRDFCLNKGMEQRTRTKPSKQKQLLPYQPTLSNLLMLPQASRPTSYRFQELLHVFSKDQPPDQSLYDILDHLQKYLFKNTKTEFESQCVDLSFILKQQYGCLDEQPEVPHPLPSYWQQLIRKYCIKNIKRPKAQNHIDYSVYQCLFSIKSSIQRQLQHQKINKSLQFINSCQVAVSYTSVLFDKYKEALADIISGCRLALLFQDEVHHHQTYYQYLSDKIISYYTSSRYMGQIEQNIYECHKRSMAIMLQVSPLRMERKDGLKRHWREEGLNHGKKNGVRVSYKEEVQKEVKEGAQQKEVKQKQSQQQNAWKNSQPQSSSRISKTTNIFTNNLPVPQEPQAPRLSQIKSVGEDQEDELSQPIDSYMRKKKRPQKQQRISKKSQSSEGSSNSDAVLKVTVIGKGPNENNNTLNKQVIYIKNGKQIKQNQPNIQKRSTHYLDAPALNGVQRKSKKLTHIISRSNALAYQKVALKQKVTARISQGIKVVQPKDLQVRRSIQGTSFVQVKSKKSEMSILPYGMLPLVVRQDYSYLLYYFGAINQQELCLKLVMDKIKFGLNIVKIVISEAQLKDNRQKLLKYTAILVGLQCQVLIEVTDNVVEQLNRKHSDVVQAIAYLSRRPFEIVIRNLQKCWRQIEMI